MRGGTRRWVALWLVGAAGCALVRAPAPPPITDGVQVGVASWYGPGFHGNRTANGEIYDQYELTAAHPSLPLGTRVMVTNLENGPAVQVRINDRGPFVGGHERPLLPRAHRSLPAAHRRARARRADRAARLSRHHHRRARAVRRSVALLVVLALLAGCASRRLVRHGQVNEDALETVRRGL